MILVFEGGLEQLTLKIDKNRDIDFNFPKITGNKFIKLEKAFKLLYKEDRNKHAVDLFKYKKYKKEKTDIGFIEYLTHEFTHNMWIGFKLRHKIKNGI